ncbi:putative membrane protein [Bacilli bacterium PM5-3]|nr:putative membrane protein [Bacilli bacterium PM5-3]
MKRFKELKNEALDSLKGKWRNVIALSIVVPFILVVIISIVTFILLSTVPTEYYSNDYGNSTEDFIASLPTMTIFLYYLIVFIGSVSAIVISFNIVYSTYKDIFTGKKEKADIFADALTVFRNGYLTKLIILTIQYMLLIFAWSLLFYIPGIIKSFSYSQAFFIFKDKMDKGEDFKPIDCITESRKMMDGYKANYFLLNFSFIGWIILGFVSLGIAMLWIEPYMNMTTVAYYENLKEVHYGNKSESISINIEV